MTAFRLSPDYINFTVSEGTLNPEDLIPIFAHFIELRFPDILPTRNYVMGVQYLMNPVTGSVDTEEDWWAVFRSASPEEWGGDAFDDAELVPVIYTDDNGWVEGSYWTEQAHDDLDAIFDVMQDIAPIGCYFGAHIGDGALFGFWQEETAECLYERLDNAAIDRDIAFFVTSGDAYVVTDETGEKAYYVGMLPPECDDFSHVYGYRAHARLENEERMQVIGVYDTEEEALAALCAYLDA